MDREWKELKRAALFHAMEQWIHLDKILESNNTKHTRTYSDLVQANNFFYTVTLWKHLGTAGLRLLKQGLYTFKHCFQNQKTPNSSVLLDSNNALPRTFRLQYLHVQQFTTPKATLVTEILAVVTELTIPINVLTWKLIIH